MRLKRLLDLLLSLIGIALFSPLYLLIALWVKLDSAGPILYWSERIGLGGRRFRIVKFRTMHVNTNQIGPAITLGDDRRITECGRWLRHYRIDEIPQLWNVLKGEMSLVGPRPEAPKYVELYSDQQKEVLSVKPGITGLTQLEYKDEATLLTGPDWEKRYIEQVLPAKLAIDLKYVRDQSLRNDLLILLRTVYRLINPYTQENQPTLRGRHLLLVDVLLVMVAYIASFALRFDNIQFWVEFLKHARLMFAFLFVKVFIFYRFGMYRRVWRYASIRELLAIFGSVTVSSTLIGIITVLLWVLPFTWSPVLGFPRSVLGIDWLLTLILIGGFRFTLRAIGEFSPPTQPVIVSPANASEAKNSLIVGTDKSVARIARELQSRRMPGFHPVGLVTDDPNQRYMSIHGLSVIGHVDDLSALITEHQIAELIIAAPEASGQFTRQVLQLTQGHNVSIKTLPSYHELIEGSDGLNSVRNIRIEDLLRRKPITTEVEQIATYVTDRRILVTGAGGSIGSELCRQISSFGPAEIILLGHGENSIFHIQQELRALFPNVQFQPVISDIRDFGRMSRLLAKYQPDIIFHAAAHKHVPMMELNPEEAIINNVLGTKVLVEAAEALGIPRLVMISSDKAVSPNNVMGGTKRVAEMIVRSVAKRSGNAYVVVRFGNVLGSRGSVIPLFQKQIENGGPVTITHPDVTRYFMTIPEAVQLVIQAAAMGTCGEVFVLNMGNPIKIYDLACDLIRLSGLQPGTDIAITFTGLRPGEKLHEALFTEAEGPIVTQHKNILMIPDQPHLNGGFWAQIERLINIAYHGDADKVRQMLQEIVPDAQIIRRGYRPQPVTQPLNHNGL